MKRLSAIFAASAFSAASLAAQAGETQQQTYSPDEVRDILDKRDEEIVVFFDQGIPCPSEETDDICITKEAVIAYSEENHTMSVWQGNVPKANDARELGASSKEYRLQLEIERAEVNNFANQRAFGTEHPFVVRHDFSQAATRADCADIPEQGLLRGSGCKPYSEIMDGVRSSAQVMWRGVVAESHRDIADFSEGNLVTYAMWQSDQSGEVLMGSSITLPNGMTTTTIPGAALKFTSYGTQLATAEQPVTLVPQ